jgi:hypothetical protein
MAKIAFYYLRTIRRFSWNGTEVSHWRFNDYRRIKHLQMFQNSKFWHFMFKCLFLLRPVLGVWTVICTWQYRPWTGSIKPSLHYFQFCRVGLSLGILICSILSPHQRCLCRVEAVKSRPVHSLRDVIFPILKDRSAWHYCCACGIFSFNFSAFSSWVVRLFLLELCWITLRICCLLFNFVFWRLICDMKAS